MLLAGHEASTTYEVAFSDMNDMHLACRKLCQLLRPCERFGVMSRSIQRNQDVLEHRDLLREGSSAKMACQLEFG